MGGRLGGSAAVSYADAMARARVQLPFHALVALVLTWPLAAHLTTAVPLGVEPVGTVPLFNLWTLRWNQIQLGELFRHYWDAPIFHPTPGAFALSEPQPLTGLFFAPISWLTHNPTLAYNVTLLVILTLNGFAAARLARRLGVAPGPAALAGVLAQALPFVAGQLGVLQLVVLFPLFLLADAVLAWAPDGGRRRGAAVGLWLAVTFLTCGYYGLFAVVVVGLASLALVRRSWWAWPRVGDLLVGAAVFAVLALPVVLGQARYTEPYHRTAETIANLSADPVDFLRLPPAGLGASFLPWLRDEGGSSHYLYPGTALLVLAAVGASAELVRTAGAQRHLVEADPGADRRTADPAAAEPISVDAVEPTVDALIDQRRRVLFCITATCLAIICSLGLRAQVGGLQPYELLRLHVPGFANLRSPFRFAALSQVFLVPLAGLALDRLWSWRPRVTAPTVGAAVGIGLAAAVVTIGVVEVTPWPERLFVVPPPGGDWVTWLQDHPSGTPPDATAAPPGGSTSESTGASTGDGSVAMVPFPTSGDVGAYESTTRWMLSGLEHGHRLANGYSGLFPATYDELEQAMQSFPSERSVASLRATGVTYVVVARSWLTPEAQGWMQDWRAELEPVFTGTDMVIYQLNR